MSNTEISSQVSENLQNALKASITKNPEVSWRTSIYYAKNALDKYEGGMTDKEYQKLNRKIASTEKRLETEEKTYKLWQYTLVAYDKNFMENLEIFDSQAILKEIRDFAQNESRYFANLSKLYNKIDCDPYMILDSNNINVYQKIQVVISRQIAEINEAINCEVNDNASKDHTKNSELQKIRTKLLSLSVDLQKRQTNESQQNLLPNSFLMNLRRQIVWGLSLEAFIVGLFVLPITTIILLSAKPLVEKLTNSFINDYLSSEFTWYIDIPLVLVTLPYLLIFGIIGLTVMSIYDAVSNAIMQKSNDMKFTAEEEGIINSPLIMESLSFHTHFESLMPKISQEEPELRQLQKERSNESWQQFAEPKNGFSLSSNSMFANTQDKQDHKRISVVAKEEMQSAPEFERSQALR